MIIKHNPKKLNKVAPIKEQPLEVPVEEELLREPESTDRVEHETEKEFKLVYSEEKGKYELIEVE